jgi:hypothetical protein
VKGAVTVLPAIFLGACVPVILNAGRQPAEISYYSTANSCDASQVIILYGKWLVIFDWQSQFVGFICLFESKTTIRVVYFGPLV